MNTETTDPLVAEIQEGFIRLVRVATRPALHQSLRDAAGVELDRSAYAIVARIAEFEPVRARDLAEYLSVDPSTLSRQIGRLVALGYVARVDDPDDGRAQRLTLLPAGRDILARFREAWHRWLDDVLADWSIPDRVALARLLPALGNAMANTPIAGT